MSALEVHALCASNWHHITVFPHMPSCPVTHVTDTLPLVPSRVYVLDIKQVVRFGFTHYRWGLNLTAVQTRLNRASSSCCCRVGQKLNCVEQAGLFLLQPSKGSFTGRSKSPGLALDGALVFRWGWGFICFEYLLVGPTEV